MLRSVLPAFGLTDEYQKIEAFGSGLINHTWKVTANGHEYILQRINQIVFNNPEAIAYNINLVSDYLKVNYPEYRFVAPVATDNGSALYYSKEEGFFRMFPFVQGSSSIDVVKTSEQAFEAAKQFGRFTKLLCGFDCHQLKITIPSFHDLSLRYQQFLAALEQGSRVRIAESNELIGRLMRYSDIAEEYKHIIADPSFKLRVTHHDTKISNVLFDENGKGLCVIDLDTLMPGYFISDVGDMMRTYLSPVSEEEKDFSKIEVRVDFYKAIVSGYFSEMKDELTEAEKQAFFYAGKFMIFMQAIRFLTDHLNDDRYYGAKYPGHNFVRAGNQLVLLEKLIEKEEELASIITAEYL